MDFKPQTFFIGVIDFFSILLPGALVTYFLMGMFYEDFFGEGKMFVSQNDETVGWIIFLLATYITGNLIFMMGSLLDGGYDKLLRKNLFQSRYDLSYKTARLIKQHYINIDGVATELKERNDISGKLFITFINDPRREIFNVFKWSQHFLLYNKPEALAEIKRSEADSKFFRSLVITFLIMALTLLVQTNFTEAIICFIISLLCFYRFGDLRFKTTEKAYEMIITYHYLNPIERQSNRSVPINSSSIKIDIEKDFELKHFNKINNLKKGFANSPRQVVINTGDLKDTFFEASQSEYWYCLQGKGTMLVKNEHDDQQHFLQPNATIPISKGNKYQLQNKHTEALELIVISQ